MAKPKKTKMGKKLSGNPLLVIVLIAGALYVNWDFLKVYLPFDGFEKKGSVQGEKAMEMDSMDIPAGTSSSPSPGSVAAYQPVGLDEDFPSPFGTLISIKKTAQEKVDPKNPDPLGGKITRPGGVPEGMRLSLVLLSGKSRSAVIGGKIVGLGDKLPFGVVQAIEKDRVEILGEGGRTLIFPLRKAPLLVHFGRKNPGKEGAAPTANPTVSTSHSQGAQPGPSGLPSVPSGPVNPTDFLKILQGFTPPKGQGKE